MKPIFECKEELDEFINNTFPWRFFKEKDFMEAFKDNVFRKGYIKRSKLYEAREFYNNVCLITEEDYKNGFYTLYKKYEEAIKEMEIK